MLPLPERRTLAMHGEKTMAESSRASCAPSPPPPPDENAHTEAAGGSGAPPYSQGIGVAGDPCQAARSIVAAAMRAVSAADGCRLCLIHCPETALLVEACERGDAAITLDAVEFAKIDRDEAAPRQALEQRRVIALPDLNGPRAEGIRPLTEECTRSLLLAPLHTEALTLGLLAVSANRPHAFSSHDAERLEGVASQAAVALHHWARLLHAEAEWECAEGIMEGLADGLVVLDNAGRITRVNRQLATLGVWVDGQVSLPCSMDDPDCPALLRTLLNPSGGAVIGPYEVTLELPAQARRTLRVFPSPLPQPVGGEMRVVRDVTTEREAVEAQALFVSQVAHELRGPLQHIMGFTSLIRDIDDLPRESYERFFGHIKDETDHLASLVDDLVELSRIELGRFTIRPEATRLDTLVARVVERLRPRSQLRGLNLTMHTPTEPVWARIDTLRITQVISNLVENALKFVPPGGAITVSVRPDGGSRAIVSVADTGPGIPPEAMEHLFQRFYQVRTDASRSTPGMGLGLYTCREIIRAHGGEIWAESEYGTGSTFHFRVDRVTP